MAAGHELVEATMILNHKHVIVTLLENVGQFQLEPRYGARVHAMLMRDLIAPEDLGRIRAHDVRITSSSYKPSNDSSQLSADLSLLLWKAEQTTNPFEAGFLLLAGLSYLQAFADGNKRMGRIFANVPLLTQGKPPLSFVGIDRSRYLSGLIAYYEVGDTELLAETVASAYEQAAPSYAAALATHRVPKFVELRERKRIGEEVKALLMGRVPVDEAEKSIRKRFRDLSPEDQGVLVACITNILRHITPENAAAWGVDADIAEAYRCL
jgi:Fic family protein